MLKTRGEIKVDLAKTWYAKKTYPLAKATEEIKKGGLKHSLSLPDHIKLNTEGYGIPSQSKTYGGRRNYSESMERSKREIAL